MFPLILTSLRIDRPQHLARSTLAKDIMIKLVHTVGDRDMSQYV